MNYPYQPYRTYTRLPNSSVHNPNIMSYVDSVLSKSRTNYASVQQDQQPKYQTYQTNSIKTDTDLKSIGNSPLILPQKSLVIQPTLKSKQEYLFPKKVEQLSFQSDIPPVIPLIPLMSDVREQYTKFQLLLVKQVLQSNNQRTQNKNIRILLSQKNQEMDNTAKCLLQNIHKQDFWLPQK
ncbi:unnamed protein product [Paramecium octaurelia]|uniref:Uncharacterized protein n=1 Tax=Paramecium octaurelia TaxID=43137 RepID=A0A8S1ULA0_PAROT|nr:unnamed protein product [Paramecium octaurelia]